MSAGIDSAVVGLFADLAAAWNRADGEAFAAPFVDDADFVEVRGGHHHGRPAIAAGHQAIFDGPYADSTVQYRVERVRELGPGAAVVIVGSTLDVPAGPLAGTHHSRLTAVVGRSGGTWRVASFHNTLVQEAPVPA